MENADNDRKEAEFLGLFWHFYRCPTTGRILQSLPHDDKVLCGCGRSNPKVLQERTEETGTHIVKFLTAATAEEYVQQRKKAVVSQGKSG